MAPGKHFIFIGLIDWLIDLNWSIALFSHIYLWAEQKEYYSKRDVLKQRIGNSKNDKSKCE